MPSIVCTLVTSEAELQEAFEVRWQVFVREQGIDESVEYDSLDTEAVHVVAREGGRAIGTARVRFPAPGSARIERMAVLEPFRRRGAGSAILSFVMQHLRDQQVSRAVLHAQTAVKVFYAVHGFSETGDPFQEAGIEHIEMYIDL